MIVCGQQKPAWLGLPGSRYGPGAGGLKSPRYLGIGHEIRNLGLYVTGERRSELLAVKKQEAVLRRQDGGAGASAGAVLMRDRTESPVSAANAQI